MHPSRPRPRRALLLAVIAAAGLAACGGGVDTEPHDDDHDPITIDTAGRLVIAEVGATALRVLDLDSDSVEATHTASDVPSALYASPGGRYAAVVQRMQDRVQFVDGGVWQEDHGDHLHDYREASRAMPWQLVGARPTHYDVQAGVQASFFMDGNAAATPVQNASVSLITDAGIAAGQTVASLGLAQPLHGLAEPVGDKLLVAARADDAADTLPTHLVLHQRNGTGYSLDRQLPTRCNGMHGSGSSGDFTLVGCIDGMLLVQHTGAATVDDGRLLATPLRVGTIAFHPRLPGQFIGIASEGAAPAPVTTRFYAVDGDTATVSSYLPQGWETGRVRRAHGYDRSGQRFFVLDDQGTLVVAQRQGNDWAPLARVTGAVPAMPAAAPYPSLVANGARDELYITDPIAGQLVVIDSLTGAVLDRHDMGYAPSTAVWLGIAR